ncbi:MAG: hypothetical protein ACXAAI_05795 [Promethearchaeota archaeon]|jgi:hypothetical protein
MIIIRIIHKLPIPIEIVKFNADCTEGDNKLLKKIFKKRINEILEKFRGQTILLSDDMANFFGQESLGVWKIRGNGVLLLTKEDLFFGMWKPQKELKILVTSISKISNPKRHLKKSVFKPLLKVNFKNSNGFEDSAAWFVRDLDKWNATLKKLTSKEI